MFAKEYTPLYRGFESHYGYYQGCEDYYDHTYEADPVCIDIVVIVIIIIIIIIILIPAVLVVDVVSSLS